MVSTEQAPSESVALAEAYLEWVKPLIKDPGMQKMEAMARAAIAADRALVASQAPLQNEQTAFEAWCPYRGSPDPRVVWGAAWKAAIASQAQPAAEPRQDSVHAVESSSPPAAALGNITGSKS